jgi:Family of unknown function (DUF5343)
VAEQKQTYPMLPISHWWALRKKFKQSIPGVVTDGYLASVLGMEANSARANVLPFLKTLGLIDDDGKTGPLANKWRDDGHYAEVCKEILKKVYPQELRDAVSDVGHRTQAERWFSINTGTGKGAAGRMASLYMTLLEADASKQVEQDKGEGKKKSVGKDKIPIKETPVRVATPATTPPIPPPIPPSTSSTHLQVPGININLEIHISADSTPEQIDQIFASMAKHLYKG